MRTPPVDQFFRSLSMDPDGETSAQILESKPSIDVLLSSGTDEFSNAILSIQEGLRQLNMETEPDEEEEEEEEIDPDVDMGVEGSPDVKKALTPVTWYEGILSCFRPFFGTQGKHRKTTEPDAWEIPLDYIKGLEFLSSGAQGRVFLGHLGPETVAVKEVKEKKDTDIHHLRKLNHDNVVLFKGVCTQSPHFYIVMEFCPHGSLYDHLKEAKCLAPSRTLDWANQIASGMSYLHAHHIIHRDLKSPNVLIGKEGMLKISDFGTSRELKEPRSAPFSCCVGTVPWMAPEVICSRPCSEKVDVWSYGVVVWELFTCEVPYKEMNPHAIMYGVGNNTLRLPVPHSFPPGVKLLMQQCLRQKPHNRPSFAQILKHLEIASSEMASISTEDFQDMQMKWQEEIELEMSEMYKKNVILDEEILKGREEELKRAEERLRIEMQKTLDLRRRYEEGMEMNMNVYMNLCSYLLRCERQLEDLCRCPNCGFKDLRKKSIRPPQLQRSSRFVRKRSGPRSPKKSVKLLKKPLYAEVMHGMMKSTVFPERKGEPLPNVVSDAIKGRKSRVRRGRPQGSSFTSNAWPSRDKSPLFCPNVSVNFQSSEAEKGVKQNCGTQTDDSWMTTSESDMVTSQGSEYWGKKQSQEDVINGNNCFGKEEPSHGTETSLGSDRNSWNAYVKRKEEHLQKLELLSRCSSSRTEKRRNSESAASQVESGVGLDFSTDEEDEASSWFLTRKSVARRPIHPKRSLSGSVHSVAAINTDVFQSQKSFEDDQG